MSYLFGFRNFSKTWIDTLKQAIESVEKDTAKLRKQKEPLEKKMMSQQEIAKLLIISWRKNVTKQNFINLAVS